MGKLLSIKNSIDNKEAEKIKKNIKEFKRLLSVEPLCFIDAVYFKFVVEGDIHHMLEITRANGDKVRLYNNAPSPNATEEINKLRIGRKIKRKYYKIDTKIGKVIDIIGVFIPRVPASDEHSSFLDAVVKKALINTLGNKEYLKYMDADLKDKVASIHAHFFSKDYSNVFGLSLYADICDKMKEFDKGLSPYYKLYEDKLNTKLKKFTESKNELSPTQKAGVEGEEKVNYALKWLEKDYIVIKPDNEERAIRIKNSDYSNESQEIDHIVVGPQGVFMIETKAYSGTIEIDKAGNWTREKSDGIKAGLQNPIQQVERHRKLLKSFLPDNIDVIPILCIADEKTILLNQENSLVPVVKSDSLQYYIENYKVKNAIPNNIKDECIRLIKSYMV